jgi:hypothetical protein
MDQGGTMPPTMSNSGIKRYTAISLLLTLSLLISIMIGEGLLRIIFDPADYLQAQLIPDDILGHRVASNHYDSWGFRNKAVPAQVKNVAIGDSVTYSILTTANDSWPGKLHKLTGQDVYNLSLGGYGPVQYYYLLKARAFQLNPSLVIVGFYFGNDIFDAYNIVYTKDFWRHLRSRAFVIETEPPVQISKPETPHGRKFLGSIRNWLAENSVLYRISVFSFGNALQFLEVKYSLSTIDPDIMTLENKEPQIRTAFRPAEDLLALDLHDARVQEGLRLTLQLLREMRDLCSERAIEFVVVLIPTKQNVFAEFITETKNIRHFNLINELLSNERELSRLMKSYFDDHGVTYIDVLPDLRRAVSKTNPYPSNLDNHLNPNGNEIVARAIQNSLNDLRRKPNNSSQITNDRNSAPKVFQ